MARGGVTKFRSMDAFGGHRTGGGGGKFLSKWKEKGEIDTWMHTKELPMAIWRHQFPQIVITEDRQTKQKTKHVWSKNLVCHEGEDVLEGQYFRDRETSARKHPAKRCGACKLVEWCYQQSLLFEDNREENEKAIAAGKLNKVKGLSFTTPLFAFEADDPDESATLHVGGICNLFNKELTDAQKKDLKAAKISLKHAWKENAWAKCQYAMCVVNNARPEDGVQIAVEASSLGDKVKKVLNDVLKESKRNIQTNPYCIKWEYHEAETDLNKKYDALPMREIVPSPRVLKLIRGESPTAELEKLTELFNQQTLRATLEKHCLLEKGRVPWDDIFPSPEQEKKWREEDDAEEESRVDEDEEPGAPADADDSDAGDDAGETSDDEEEFECDNDACDAIVKASDKECPKCGQKFEVTDEDPEPEPEPEPEPPKKPMRTRAQAAADKAAAEKSAKGGKGAKGKKDDDQDSDVPF